ncbi:M20/M25/M40 family metallo-hydrolase [Paraferrimonas sedimenticola]|uniref:Carboxypeptidase Q n=1 Tax=Paraferrimonas sedimenticola TaxID=375674 RepID=A0AA37W1X5_9GAMM|nr:M20/M25/M40 family metallo-hydrolase [Paraferrimonas sedimenticola]GLP97153.1 peptidase M28 [Paraferrimonas sedimenticola]
MQYHINKTLTFFLLLTFSATTFATQQNPTPAQVKALQQQALNSDLSYQLVESLTVEIGPRLPGTVADIKTVEWSEKQLKRLGFDKVYREPVTIPVWKRGDAKASITAPFPQNIVVTALGGSVATPKEGIEAEIVRFDSIEQVEQASAAEIEGKIVFIDPITERHRTGKGYGKVVGARSKGAVESAKKGAVAVVIRSIGTDSDRFAHTGMMRYADDVVRIPAAAMSVPDAELVNAMLKRDLPVKIKLHMTPAHKGEGTSYNVIGEITGSQYPDEIVLLGAHHDSWDEGTGALDDGAGMGIVMATGAIIKKSGIQPKRTLRVVLYAAEEIGLIGAKAYVEAHKAELDKHKFALESDFGAGYIWRFDTRVNDSALPAMQKIADALAPLGIERGHNEASGGPDVSMLPNYGVPVVSLQQDGSDYFDYHHTPNDTLDKIDPVKMKQNTAAWVTFAILAAAVDTPLRPIPPKE